MSDISLATLADGKPVRIEKNGETICLTRIGSEVFAINDVCSHSDASLSEGDISDFKIECWLHGAEFDLRTGEALTPPAVAPVKDKKGRIVTPAVPAIPAKIPAVLPSGKPAPATLTQTLPKGIMPNSQPSQVTTPLRLPPTRPQLAAPVIAGGIPSPVVGSAGSNMFTRNPVRTGLGAAAIAGAAGLAGQDLTAPDGAPNRSIPFAPAAPAKTQEMQLPAR